VKLAIEKHYQQGGRNKYVRNKFELADVNAQIHVWKFTPAITI